MNKAELELTERKLLVVPFTPDLESQANILFTPSRFGNDYLTAVGSYALPEIPSAGNSRSKGIREFKIVLTDQPSHPEIFKDEISRIEQRKLQMNYQNIAATAPLSGEVTAKTSFIIRFLPVENPPDTYGDYVAELHVTAYKAAFERKPLLDLHNDKIFALERAVDAFGAYTTLFVHQNSDLNSPITFEVRETPAEIKTEIINKKWPLRYALINNTQYLIELSRSEDGKTKIRTI